MLGRKKSLQVRTSGVVAHGSERSFLLEDWKIRVSESYFQPSFREHLWKQGSSRVLPSHSQIREPWIPKQKYTVRFKKRRGTWERRLSQGAQTSFPSTTRHIYKWPRKLWFNGPACGIKCQQLSQFWKLVQIEKQRKKSALYTHTVLYTWFERPENSPEHFYRYVSFVSLHSLVSQTISFSSFR